MKTTPAAIQKAAWYADIFMARAQRDAELIQGVPIRPWVTEKDEMARLQAIKEILQSEPT